MWLCYLKGCFNALAMEEAEQDEVRKYLKPHYHTSPLRQRGPSLPIIVLPVLSVGL